jgi:hypothetical protein
VNNEVLYILKRLESKIINLDVKFDRLETKVDDHTQILRALWHSAEDKLGMIK